MRDVRRDRAPQPVRPVTEAGREDAGRATPTHRAASASRSARRSRWPAADPDTRYALGSVLNHVLLHQTVIGEEALQQLAAVGRDARPDRRLHRRRVQLRRAGLPVPAARSWPGGCNPVIRAVEPDGVPVVHPGPLRLRLRRHRRVHAAAEDAHARPRLRARPDPRRRAALPRHVAAAVAHVRAGPVRGGGQAADASASRPGCGSPAPRGSSRRPSRPTRWPRSIAEALRCTETGEEKVILTALCGHGHFDMAAYDRYLSGEMEDRAPPGAHRHRAGRTADPVVARPTISVTEMLRRVTDKTH